MRSWLKLPEKIALCLFCSPNLLYNIQNSYFQFYCNRVFHEFCLTYIISSICFNVGDFFLFNPFIKVKWLSCILMYLQECMIPHILMWTSGAIYVWQNSSQSTILLSDNHFIFMYYLDYFSLGHMFRSIKETVLLVAIGPRLNTEIFYITKSGKKKLAPQCLICQ